MLYEKNGSRELSQEDVYKRQAQNRIIPNRAVFSNDDVAGDESAGRYKNGRMNDGLVQNRPPYLWVVKLFCLIFRLAGQVHAQLAEGGLIHGR